MSVNAGKGSSYPYNLVHYLKANITFNGATTVSLGWLPPNSFVVGSGCMVVAAWNGTGNEEVDLGFRNSVQGATTDTDAFSETAFDLDAAVGFTDGDVTQTANLFFTAPAEVIATVTNTDATAGNAWVYVAYVLTDN